MNEFINKNICGDAVHIMKQLPDNTIDLTITSPPYDCYSDDTEVLTLNGWKLIKDVYIGEKVLTLNPNTKEVYYENVINTFNYKYDGDMINFKNTFLDILVTPNHNMYVEYRDGSPTRERKCFIPKDKLKSSFLKKASDVKVSDLLRLNGFEWIGIEKDFFILPEMELIYNKRILNFSSKKIDMKLWCEFLGLYLSEGSCRGSNGGKKNSYQINIKQKDGISNDYLKSVLDRMPYKYFNYKKGLINNYYITDKQLYEYLKKFGNSYEKYIPSYIKELNKEYLKLFLLSYLIGDGSKKDKDDIFNLNNYNMVKSFSKKMRLDIMDILIKLGYSSCEIKNKFVTVCRSSNYSKISKFKNIISYNGNIVCVEVENNNIIYVKRNNKAFFCGNCLRTYNGKITDEKYNSHYSFPFEDIANELFRITKDGGIVVWVVNDQIVNGGESGNSFRQALKFQEIGFKLYDTMIYHKNGPPFPETNRYSQVFEYMFVLLKGKRPNTINIIKDRENKWAGSTTFGTPTHRKKNGDLVKSKQFEVAKYGSRYNVWYIKNGKGFGGDELSHSHPASFPESLAEDHILSWSKEGDIILDPMVGSGTTSKMSKKNNRNFIGIDLNQDYIDLANKRIELVVPYTLDDINPKSKFILSRENALLKRKRLSNKGK